MSRYTLTETQVREARIKWDEGQPLGMIAKDLGCSIYDLSPWLYIEDLEAAYAAQFESTKSPCAADSAKQFRDAAIDLWLTFEDKVLLPIVVKLNAWIVRFKR